jgi:hypothetical protein
LKPVYREPVSLALASTKSAWRAAYLGAEPDERHLAAARLMTHLIELPADEQPVRSAYLA